MFKTWNCAPLLRDMQRYDMQLRPLMKTDVKPLINICNTMDVARFVAQMPHPFKQQHAKQYISFARANQNTVFGIEVENQLAGVVSTQSELEYFLAKEWWGYGLATTASRLALERLFTQTPRDFMNSGYFHGNPASGRVLQKLGFLPTQQRMMGTRNLPMAVHHAMTLTRARWRQLSKEMPVGT